MRYLTLTLLLSACGVDSMATTRDATGDPNPVLDAGDGQVAPGNDAGPLPADAGGQDAGPVDAGPMGCPLAYEDAGWFALNDAGESFRECVESFANMANRENVFDCYDFDGGFPLGGDGGWEGCLNSGFATEDRDCIYACWGDAGLAFDDAGMPTGDQTPEEANCGNECGIYWGFLNYDICIAPIIPCLARTTPECCQ